LELRPMERPLRLHEFAQVPFVLRRQESNVEDAHFSLAATPANLFSISLGVNVVRRSGTHPRHRRHSPQKTGCTVLVVPSNEHMGVKLEIMVVWG